MPEVKTEIKTFIYNYLCHEGNLISTGAAIQALLRGIATNVLTVK